MGLTRRCPLCNLVFADPIRFCEQDGTLLVEARLLPRLRAILIGAAGLAALAAGLWLGTREYLSGSVVLEVIEVRPPVVRATGSAYMADSGTVAMRLALQNRSKLSFTLTAATFEIVAASLDIKTQPVPHEKLPVWVAAGSTLPISLESDSVGRRELKESSYDLAVQGRFQAALWGIPLEFPASASARVRIVEKP